MTSELQEYLKTIEQCLEQCYVMQELEADKRKAILSGDDDALEHAMAKQQADMMRFEVLEKERVAAQSRAGFAGTQTASELLEAMPDTADKEAVQTLITQLRDAVAELQRLNREANELAKRQLLMLQSIGGAPAQSDSPTYKAGQDRKQEWAGGRSFEENI